MGIDAQKKKMPSSRTSTLAKYSSSEGKFRSIIENLPEILALISAEGIIQYVSPYTERALGYRNGDLEGHNVFDFIHPEDVLRAAEEFSDTVRKEGEGVPSLLRLRDTSGTWIPFEIIANNLFGDPQIGAVI